MIRNISLKRSNIDVHTKMSYVCFYKFNHWYVLSSCSYILHAELATAYSTTVYFNDEYFPFSEIRYFFQLNWTCKWLTKGSIFIVCIMLSLTMIKLDNRIFHVAKFQYQSADHNMYLWIVQWTTVWSKLILTIGIFYTQSVTCWYAFIEHVWCHKSMQRCIPVLMAAQVFLYP